jgi:hypothetical protein
MIFTTKHTKNTKPIGVHGVGVLTKWNGARVSHPQLPELPDERTKFQGFLRCRAAAAETAALHPVAILFRVVRVFRGFPISQNT